MRRVLFLFLDGVGLGSDEPTVNPLAAAKMPFLCDLLEGRRPIAQTGAVTTARVAFAPVDARLGMPGRPQSATGQASILSGMNAPQRVGEHFGPRPNDAVREVIDKRNLFATLRKTDRAPFFANAYPHGYFDNVRRGKRLLSAIPYAAVSAGLRLPNYEDLAAGKAIAADFTNAGWRTELGYAGAPVYTPEAGGRLLWEIAAEHRFVFFEHWLTDLLGHRKAFAEAVANFERFDAFLTGLCAAADLGETLIVVSSDHGNVEDCSHGKHTLNPAFGLLIGSAAPRYAGQLTDLTSYWGIVTDYLLRAGSADSDA